MLVLSVVSLLLPPLWKNSRTTVTSIRIAIVIITGTKQCSSVAMTVIVVASFMSTGQKTRIVEQKLIVLPLLLLL